MMTGAAQLERLSLSDDEGATDALLIPVDAGAQERLALFAPAHLQAEARSELRLAAAEKLAAHRQRRARMTPTPDGAQNRRTPSVSAAPNKKDRIAAAVAERYAQTPSYRAFLAEEAERAAHQAAAAAEVAARNAEAVRAVQQELLAELELWTAPQEFSEETAIVSSHPETGPSEQSAAPKTLTPRSHRVPPPLPAPPAALSQPVREHAAGGLTVRLYEDNAVAGSVLRRSTAVTPPRGAEALSDDEARTLHELDEEIAFRQAPVFEPYSVGPPTPLPANLLEFPRQLIAAKKIRPHLAEGPLYEDAPRSSQLRIFEVEPEQISTQPAQVASAPAWTGMRLDEQPSIQPDASALGAYEAVILAEQLAPSTPESIAAAPRTALAPLPVIAAPQPAPLSLRLMAGLVDLGLVLFALLGAIAGCVKLTGWLPAGQEAGISAAVAVLVLYVCYYLLFFTLTDQTPGMRYARLGLCTFTDENPSRGAMRGRLVAQFVAAVPLGIGLLWALIDEQHMGWHDRMSQMYLRAY